MTTTNCACCEAYGFETPATTTAPAIVNDEANGFVRATPGEDLPSCDSCRAETLDALGEEEAIEITALDLHAFYGVPLPEGWTGAERLSVRPGLCTEAFGEDAAGDLSDLAPTAEQFAELRAELA